MYDFGKFMRGGLTPIKQPEVVTEVAPSVPEPPKPKQGFFSPFLGILAFLILGLMVLFALHQISNVKTENRSLKKKLTTMERQHDSEEFKAQLQQEIQKTVEPSLSMLLRRQDQLRMELVASRPRPSEPVAAPKVVEAEPESGTEEEAAVPEAASGEQESKEDTPESKAPEPEASKPAAKVKVFPSRRRGKVESAADI